MKKRNIVVAITGASGAAYAVRLLEILPMAGCDVQLTISAAAAAVMRQELDLIVDLEKFKLSMLSMGGGPDVQDSKLRRIRNLAGISSEESSVLSASEGNVGKVSYHYFRDYTSRIASGSYMTDGMVICPCSSGTLSAIVHGNSTNLIQRAAEVHLKERRKLILVPRETPLSLMQVDNMKRALEAGAILMPAMPGFYHGVTCVQDLVDFVVGRICDQLGVENELIRRWGS